jgi:hypothetical protein
MTTKADAGVAAALAQVYADEVAGRRVQQRPTDAALVERVIGYVGDPGLAVDAILMDPRPQWLRRLIGGDMMRVWPRGTG